MHLTVVEAVHTQLEWCSARRLQTIILPQTYSAINTGRRVALTVTDSTAAKRVGGLSAAGGEVANTPVCVQKSRTPRSAPLCFHLIVHLRRPRGCSLKVPGIVALTKPFCLCLRQPNRTNYINSGNAVVNYQHSCSRNSYGFFSA